MNDHKWPNLFLVGAMKAGTSSLFRILHRHPDIFMPFVKEPHFFADEEFKQQYSSMTADEIVNYRKKQQDKILHNTIINSENDYLMLYEDAGTEKYRGDASPSYLPTGSAPSLISSKCENARILMILRDPVHRAYSHYAMDLAIGRTKLSFTEAVSIEISGKKVGSDFGYLSTGLYYDQVRNYLETFGINNVHIILYDNFIEDRKTVLDNLADFLQIDKFNIDAVSEQFNPGLIPRSILVNRFLHSLKVKDLIRKIIPAAALKYAKRFYYRQDDISDQVPDSCIAKLRNYFAVDIQRTSGLIDRNLESWLSS